MKNKILIFFTVFASFVLGGTFMYVVVGIKDNGDNKQISTNYNSCSNCMSGTMIVNNSGISDSVNKVYDSVVMVKNYKKDTDNGSGSGFVYKKDEKYGYIITNNHVIENATSVSIVNASGEEVEGTILGKDEYLDLAVIRIPSNKVIAVAKMGTSNNLKRGEPVFAIGTPVGETYFNSVTGGYISGIDRKVTVSVETTNDWVQEVIQIDAAINPGNSGGPLFNINGEVIGVTSMKLINSSIEGMGLAIKIDDVVKHIDELENGNKINRPYLGISHLNITETYALKKYNITIDEDIKYGVAVVEVVKNSSAEKAGIKKGDVIIGLNEDKVTNMAYLKYLLYKYKVGDTIEIKYIRDGKTMTTKVALTDNAE